MTKKIIFASLIIILLIIIGCTTTTISPPEKQPTKPTEIDCTTNSDCVIGGCSGTLCHKKGENILTTCEYLPEYDCYRLINCGCVNNKCEWEKTAVFEKCLQDKKEG